MRVCAACCCCVSVLVAVVVLLHPVPPRQGLPAHLLTFSGQLPSCGSEELGLLLTKSSRDTRISNYFGVCVDFSAVKLY